MKFEIGRGDVAAAKSRLESLKGISHLPITKEIDGLAAQFMKAAILPANALPDALHISVAVVHEVDFLLTWNCKHIANVEITSILRKISLSRGLGFPIICTPMELMRGEK